MFCTELRRTSPMELRLQFNELIFQTKYNIGYTDCIELFSSEEASTHFNWQSLYDKDVGDDLGYCNLSISQQTSLAPLFYDHTWNEFLCQSCGFISKRTMYQIHFNCTCFEFLVYFLSSGNFSCSNKLVPPIVNSKWRT